MKILIETITERAFTLERRNHILILIHSQGIAFRAAVAAAIIAADAVASSMEFAKWKSFHRWQSFDARFATWRRDTDQF